MEMARILHGHKEELAQILALFLNKMFREKKQDVCKLILKTLSALRYNVNVKLLLEAFLIRKGQLPAS